MTTRGGLQDGVATALWGHIGTGRRPAAISKCADDLLSLYEERNTLSEVVKRLSDGGVSLDSVPEMMTDAALGVSEHAVDVMHRAGVAVPTMTIVVDGSQLRWEGEPGAAPMRWNPTTRAGGPVAVLLEDEPPLQRGTSRWIRKIFPGAEVVVADNVDDAVEAVESNPGLAVIVSDVDVLGDKSGLDFFRIVQERWPDLVDRFVFFTGNSTAAGLHYRYVAKGQALEDDLRQAIQAHAPMRRNGAAPLSAADLKRFAADVIEAAGAVIGADARSGRKVFISEVEWAHRHVLKRPWMDPQDFRRALFQAHQAQLLVLSRCDVVSSFDPAMVAASEMAVPGATFHFVTDPYYREPSIQQAPARADSAPRAPAGAMRIGGMDLQQFADLVTESLRLVKESHNRKGLARGRYGAGNVFIGSLWDEMRREPRLRGESLERFKRGLIEAQREGLLKLARADLVDDMDRDEIEESEIEDLGAHFHFVIDERALRRNPPKLSPSAIGVIVLEALPSLSTGSGRVPLSTVWQHVQSNSRLVGVSFDKFAKLADKAADEGYFELAGSDVIDPTPRRAAPMPAPVIARAAPAVRSHVGGASASAEDVAELALAALPKIKATPAPPGDGVVGATLGRYGPQKVFVSAIWRLVGADPRLGGMSLPEFKRKLLEARRRGLLTLARADLVGAMPLSEVAGSEIKDTIGGIEVGTVHFVMDPDVTRRA